MELKRQGVSHLFQLVEQGRDPDHSGCVPLKVPLGQHLTNEPALARCHRLLDGCEKYLDLTFWSLEMKSNRNTCPASGILHLNIGSLLEEESSTFRPFQGDGQHERSPRRERMRIWANGWSRQVLIPSSRIQPFQLLDVLVKAGLKSTGIVFPNVVVEWEFLGYHSFRLHFGLFRFLLVKQTGGLIEQEEGDQVSYES